MDRLLAQFCILTSEEALYRMGQGSRGLFHVCTFQRDVLHILYLARGNHPAHTDIHLTMTSAIREPLREIDCGTTVQNNTPTKSSEKCLPCHKRTMWSCLDNEKQMIELVADVLEDRGWGGVQRNEIKVKEVIGLPGYNSQNRIFVMKAGKGQKVKPEVVAVYCRSTTLKPPAWVNRLDNKLRMYRMSGIRPLGLAQGADWGIESAEGLPMLQQTLTSFIAQAHQLDEECEKSKQEAQELQRVAAEVRVALRSIGLAAQQVRAELQEGLRLYSNGDNAVKADDSDIEGQSPEQEQQNAAAVMSVSEISQNTQKHEYLLAHSAEMAASKRMATVKLVTQAEREARTRSQRAARDVL